jgi:hypothetical protein
MNAPQSGNMEFESSFNSLSCSSEFLSDEDVLNSMKPIMNMVLSGKIEAKLEASRLLCELSLRDDMHQHLIESGCLRVLVEILLPSKICEWTPRHAINALGNLAGNCLFFYSTCENISTTMCTKCELYLQ